MQTHPSQSILCHGHQWQRTSGMMTFTSSLPPSPAQMTKGTECSSSLYFSATVPSSALLCSPLMLSRVFISTCLISLSSYFAWETQIGKYEVFAKDHLLFLSEKLHIYLLHQVICRTGTFYPLSPSLPGSSDWGFCLNSMILIFSHLKRIGEKCEIPTQFIRNKIEAENQVTEPDRQQSRMRLEKKFVSRYFSKYMAQAMGSIKSEGLVSPSCFTPCIFSTQIIESKKYFRKK